MLLCIIKNTLLYHHHHLIINKCIIQRKPHGPEGHGDSDFLVLLLRPGCTLPRRPGVSRDRARTARPRGPRRALCMRTVW